MRLSIGRRPSEPDALRGSIDMLILRRCRCNRYTGGASGFAFNNSHGRLDVNQGSLDPALQRLEHQGLIDNPRQRSENNRRARYYEITKVGRKALGDEVNKWLHFAETVTLVLESR